MRHVQLTLWLYKKDLSLAPETRVSGVSFIRLYLQLRSGEPAVDPNRHCK